MRKLIALLLLAAPAAWPCASGGTCTYWLFDTAVGSYGKLDEGSAPNGGVSTFMTGTFVNLNTNHATPCSDKDRMVYNSAVTSTCATNNAPVAPNGNNGFRSLNPITGSFAAANWTVTIEAAGEATQGGSFCSQVNTFWNWSYRVWKSVNADGSAATELTAGEQSLTQFTCDNTGNKLASLAFNPGAVTFTNEYVLMTLSAFANTTALSSVNVSATMYTGLSKIVTSTFTSGVPQRLMLGVGQ